MTARHPTTRSAPIAGAPVVLALILGLMLLGGCLLPQAPASPTRSPSATLGSIAGAFVLPDEDAAVASTPTRAAGATAQSTAEVTATRTPRPRTTATRTPRSPVTPTRTLRVTRAATDSTFLIPTPEPGERLPVIRYASLPAQAKETVGLIQRGGPFPYRQDGATFQNRERRLPARPAGYYREYTVETPGSPDRGARRLVRGQKGELYYTADHYGSFRRVVP